MFVLAREPIATFDSPFPLPQTKTECIATQDVVILGQKVGNICVGWATFKRTFRIEYHAQITGPDRTDEYMLIAERCLPGALGAAYAAWVGTPGEINIKTAAAVAAGQAAFWACAGVDALRFEITDEGGWTDWERL